MIHSQNTDTNTKYISLRIKKLEKNKTSNNIGKSISTQVSFTTEIINIFNYI